MTLYYSATHGKFFAIGQMNIGHIRNAAAKIRAGNHAYYSPMAASRQLEKYGDLVEELDKRNLNNERTLRQEIQELRKKEDRHVPNGVLEDFRSLALTLISQHGHVTADTLRREAETSWGLYTPANFHALSSVFKDKRFKKIGFMQSRIPSNRGRYIAVWSTEQPL